MSTLFADPPHDSDINYAAISPYTGEIFATRRTGNNDLILVVGNSYVAVGPIGLSPPVHGLAFGVPEPATLSLLAFGGLALLRRR